MEWKVKCCKCGKPGIGTWKSNVYCTKHLLEAKQNRNHKDLTQK